MGGEQGLDLSAISLLEEKPGSHLAALPEGKNLLAGQAALRWWGN